MHRNQGQVYSSDSSKTLDTVHYALSGIKPIKSAALGSLGLSTAALDEYLVHVSLLMRMFE